MYIRFISLEMFITDKGGWGTHHVPSQNSLLPYKEDWAFLLKGKVAMVRKWCWDSAALGSSDVDHTGQLLHPGRFLSPVIKMHHWWRHFIVITILVLTINIIITNLLRRISPCLIHCWYWAFLLSGRLVITMPPTCRINNSFRLGNVRYNQWPGYY